MRKTREIFPPSLLFTFGLIGFPTATFEFYIEDIIELSNNGEAYFVLSVALKNSFFIFL